MAGSSSVTCGYSSRVFAIEPTANGRGSTSSAAPFAFAARTAAPYAISPCVSVGPSSMASTRLPATVSPFSSKRNGEAANTIFASGLTLRIESSTASTPSGGAVSTLFTTHTWAMRRFVSPGW